MITHNLSPLVVVEAEWKYQTKVYRALQNLRLQNLEPIKPKTFVNFTIANFQNKAGRLMPREPPVNLQSLKKSILQ